jgi:hypothetical protein
MKAVIHCDMVGGNYNITKSVLRVTRTPASLPSSVNAVGAVFTEYAIKGSIKGSSGEGFSDALLSEEGSKESLVAETTPYAMGSDHDVYQEGSFRIPAIYLRDWPDVFIHTNNDKPSNIDPTKLKRSTFIAAASGYFLASAGAARAARLADEVFARAMARVPRDHQRATRLESAGPSGVEESRNIIVHSLEAEAEALASVLELAPGDAALQKKVEGLVDQLSGAWLLLTGLVSEQRKGNRVIFTIESREREQPRERRPRNPKDAAKITANPEFAKVPVRRVTGPMQIYYYDYVEDRARPQDLLIVDWSGATGMRRESQEPSCRSRRIE